MERRSAGAGRHDRAGRATIEPMDRDPTEDANAPDPAGSDDPAAPDEAVAPDDPAAPDDAVAPEQTTAPDGHESAYALLQRGLDLLQRRHFAQAAIVLERADRMETGRGSILEALGRAYYNSGQHDRSRATFEALLEVDPSAHYAHYALGQSLKLLGRPREARTHLRLAVALNPSSPLYRGALQRLGPPPPSEDETASST
jgi:tetratricopeptide (TPR) repeat protein